MSIASDSDIEIPEDNDLEAIEINNVETNEEIRDEPAAGETAEAEGATKPVKAKRVIRNPQPKLNAERLKGPRGLTSLESHFDRVKYKGKGYEEQDLSVILKTYEYWCHRLFPKYPFDECISKIEALGTKRAVVTHIKRIRFDMVDNPPVLNDQVDSEPEQDNSEHDDTTQQEHSLELTEEQLERIRINKEMAEKRRQEKLKQRTTEASTSLFEESETLPMPNQDEFPSDDEEVLTRRSRNEQILSDDEFPSDEDFLTGRVRSDIPEPNQDEEEISTGPLRDVPMPSQDEEELLTGQSKSDSPKPIQDDYSSDEEILTRRSRNVRILSEDEFPSDEEQVLKNDIPEPNKEEEEVSTVPMSNQDEVPSDEEELLTGQTKSGGSKRNLDKIVSDEEESRDEAMPDQDQKRNEETLSQSQQPVTNDVETSQTSSFQSSGISPMDEDEE